MTNPVKLVQRFYAALGRGDISAVLTVLDPDVEWTEAERFPYYGGTWHNPQAVIDNLPRISNLIQTSRPSGGLERLYS